MPSKSSRVPAPNLHKQTGQARVRIEGRDFYLGRFGSPQAEETYRRLVAEYLTTGQLPGPARSAGGSLTVAELIVAYRQHCEAYYVKDGQQTSEVGLIKDSLRVVRELYGLTAAAEFGPLKLKAVRDVMISRDWCRASINLRIGKVKRMFRWAVENELIPPSVHHGLSAVVGLRAGRTEAKESQPVRPVEDADVNAALKHLNRQLVAMVKLQSLTGMRPGEVCIIRPCDIDRNGDVWTYRPASHKTQHHGRARVVFMGTRAQAVLAPWLDDRPAETFCFSPAEARRERHAAMRAARKTPVQPSQRDRSKAKPKKRPAVRYCPLSYAEAIRRACRAAGVEPWSPNRLRHTAATAIRQGYGLEGAQIILGHSKADVTQIYAERDSDLGRRIAGEIG